MFGNADCSFVPLDVAPEAGIAGRGVLLSFVFTAILALTMSASLMLSPFVRRGGAHNPILRKLLNNYSDQQILTGIGIQAVGLARADVLTGYHIFMIWMLSLLSMATHNATLLALVHDFRRDWVLRWLRQALMFVNLVLSCVLGIFVLESKIRGLPETLPIGCVWSVESDASKVGGLDYTGTIATMAGNAIVFGLATWYLHDRDHQRFYRPVQLAGLLLMAAIALGELSCRVLRFRLFSSDLTAAGATARVILLSQAFGTPSVPLRDQSETDWSFGQLLSMLMLALPVVSAVEMMRGEMAVPPHVLDASDMQPLFDTRLDDLPKTSI